ncbi:MAG: ATP-binding cassette domain-containing protein [Lachnospiraceae bacterium]|nr:ATP-binding cassette domain-containing protein [Lachnospiraceae bacterium]
MSIIQVNDLSFTYEGSFDPVFEHASFTMDSDWKLGLIGRNGKGKTTLLRLLMGNYEYTGSIQTNRIFDYFPYKISNEQLSMTADELCGIWKPSVESWQVLRELPLLGLDSEVLYRPFETLSYGERTKVMLAVLFSDDQDFLLIDEPTNHLDRQSRKIVQTYLSRKKGFILVSHDRDLLDACVDHVLILGRALIEVQAGNFSSYWENKRRADQFAAAENERLEKEIGKLKEAARRASGWASKNEATKIGFDPVKEHDRFLDTRAFIGAKTKKMQSRVASYEKRMERQIEEKEGLLQNIDSACDLKLMPMEHYKKALLEARELSLQYNSSDSPVFEDLTFTLDQGDVMFLTGDNGSGKSSLIHAVLDRIAENTGNYSLSGTLNVAPNLVISYINQDTSHLSGTLREFARERDLDYSLFLSLLRQLDLERTAFERRIEEFSEGQKKKVLIAASLLTSAHLYIWDEPLNYIDVFSRMQLETLIKKFRPTMLIVEHDSRFRKEVGTGEICLSS